MTDYIWVGGLYKVDKEEKTEQEDEPEPPEQEDDQDYNVPDEDEGPDEEYDDYEIGFTEEEEKANYEIISNEIVRQYANMDNYLTSLDSKSGVLLGFVVLVLAQVFLNLNSVKSVLSYQLSGMLFISGVFLVIVSAFFGIRSFSFRANAEGPELEDLMANFRRGLKRDYRKLIDASIFAATKVNDAIRRDKVFNISLMMYLFATGLVIIVVSLLIALVGV